MSAGATGPVGPVLTGPLFPVGQVQPDHSKTGGAGPVDVKETRTEGLLERVASHRGGVGEGYTIPIRMKSERQWKKA